MVRVRKCHMKFNTGDNVKGLIVMVPVPDGFANEDITSEAMILNFMSEVKNVSLVDKQFIVVVDNRDNKSYSFSIDSLLDIELDLLSSDFEETKEVTIPGFLHKK